MKAKENYYESNYPSYELQNSDEKLSFYLSIMQTALPERAQVFELGVGKGIFFKRASRHFQMSGCDINSDGIAATHALNPGAQLFLGSTETLETFSKERGAPDAVVSWDVLEHLPDIQSGLISIYRSLKPGAVLIGVVPVYDGPLGFLVKALDKDPTHVTKVGRYDWIHFLETAGFQVQTWGGILRKLVGQHYYHFTEPQRLLKHVGSAMYFVARKPA